MPSEIHDRGRGPEIAETRITVYDILDYHFAGWDQTPIAVWFRLSSPQVLAALRYYEDNRETVMAGYDAMRQRHLRGNSPELEEKMKRSRAKLMAWREHIAIPHIANPAGDTCLVFISSHDSRAIV